MPTEVIFLKSVSPDASIRDKELAKSEVRSHAARISHSKPENTAKSSNARFKSSALGTPQFEVNKWRHVPPKRKHVKPRIASVKGCSAMSSRDSSPFSQPGDNHADRHDPNENSRSARTAVASRRCQSTMYLIHPLRRREIDQIGQLYWNLSALGSAQFCSMMKVKTILTREWLQFMEDEAFFHVGAALVKGEYQELQSVQGSARQEIFAHKTRALELIQERLAKANGTLDNVTLLAILLLPFTDDLISDKISSVIHWGAASKILQARGGIRAIEAGQHGRYTAEVINQVRGFCLAHTGINMLANDSYTESVPSPAYIPSPSLSDYIQPPPPHLPVGLQVLGERGLIGDHTYQLIQNIWRTPWSLQRVSEAHLSGKDINEDGLTSSFQDSWDLFNLVPSSIEDEPSIEIITCAAIIVYSTRIMGPIRMVNLVCKAARAHLTGAIEQCVTRRRVVEEEDALFWASAVGIEAWKNRLGELMNEGAALRDFQARRFPAYMTRDMSNTVLEQFIYDERLVRCQGEIIDRYWMQRSKHHKEDAVG